MNIQYLILDLNPGWPIKFPVASDSRRDYGGTSDIPGPGLGYLKRDIPLGRWRHKPSWQAARDYQVVSGRKGIIEAEKFLGVFWKSYPDKINHTST
ncbi:hypothetical protein CEXT_11591 [Caerostris extrusa]|uniref:Uncharacterized protein n=1 Tax=Caerostris extrusa TaxID=172846 RepID=A0AAV4XAM5_CAEEX|nr:hypothetical protein CEXT_11591 [Caerostris extrusa]